MQPAVPVRGHDLVIVLAGGQRLEDVVHLREDGRRRAGGRQDRLGEDFGQGFADGVGEQQDGPELGDADIARRIGRLEGDDVGQQGPDRLGPEKGFRDEGALGRKEGDVHLVVPALELRRGEKAVRAEPGGRADFVTLPYLKRISTQGDLNGYS